MSLIHWGWNSAWAERFLDHRAAGLAPARVVGGSRGVFALETENGGVRGELAGRLEYSAVSAVDLPVAGDWVAVTPTDPALMVAVVERQSLFTRVVDDETQPLAANADVAFLVSGLDGDWSPNRLDRYLALANLAGVKPVVVLNKRDVCADPQAALAHAEKLAPAVLLSAWQDDVPALLGQFLARGQTAALFGSSGVGKSTIVNALAAAEAQTTCAVREWDSRGRHTTTSRTLLRLPQGWLLLDMPGLRSVGVGGGVEDAFAEITRLAAACRFTDCTHGGEPGCAVVGAVTPGRLASYNKLRKEAEYQHRREDPAAQRALKEKWKKIHTAMRQRPGKRG
ncbi:MAG: ribosome small subunit-dependent GTPase A [Acidobacteria bacterium]|nr:ribosome small subunit-dependent GTPase A [Acidobacteriota bacterium]